MGKKEWFSFSFVINYQIRTCANRNKLLHFMNHFLNKKKKRIQIKYLMYLRQAWAKVYFFHQKKYQKKI